MEIKKSNKADLESKKGTHFLVGSITALSVLFACFEYTTREFKETSQVYAAASFAPEEEIIPITQPIFTAAPPPPADVPAVADIIDIVDDNQQIEETKIETTESTTEALTGPTLSHVAASNVSLMPTIEDTDEEEIVDVAQVQPEFPGGSAKLMEWLAKNLKYPAAAQELCVQGRVVVQFVVNKDGSIVEPKVIKSIDPSLDREAIRVVSSMPKWSPGRQGGRNVRVRFTLPVTFRLQ